MAFSARLSGTLEVAAALAFHLPGTRLDLSSPNGAQCSVGPLTDPRCSLHPAEFRELVMVAGAGGLLGSMLGYELEDNPQISLAAAEGVEHLGGGLYQVTGTRFRIVRLRDDAASQPCRRGAVGRVPVGTQRRP